jgi:hypothetical protein
MKNRLLAFVFIAACFGQAAHVNHVNANISVIEMHAENVSNCAEGSQNYLVIGLKSGTGSISYVWVATSNPQYKDLGSISLTAMASGMKVRVQADNDGDYKICGWKDGKLRFMALSN